MGDLSRAKAVLTTFAIFVAALTHARDEHYVAVATSPPAGWTFDSSRRGQFGFGWHTESLHDASQIAVAECKRQGGDICSSDATGQSLRGGCVGLALAKWRDRDKDGERAYLATGSSFREHITDDLKSACRRKTFGGKHRDTVVEHSCDVLRVVCADDVNVGEAAEPEKVTDSCEGWNREGFFKESSPDLVAHCLDNGLDPNIRDEGGVSPLHNAAREGPVESVRLLLLNGADVNARARGSEATPIWSAVRFDRVESVRALLQAGADANVRDHVEMTPLGLVRGTANGVRILRALLSADADPNMRSDGFPPMYYALIKGESDFTVQIVRLLLAAGANPNATTEDGGLTLFLALDSRNKHNVRTLQIVRLLLAAGANPNTTDRHGSPPLWHAVDNRRGHNKHNVRIVEALLEAGADPTGRQSTGWTNLHEALLGDENGSTVRIVELLLAAGADPSARAGNGWAPFDLIDGNSPLRGTDAFVRLELGATEAPAR